MYGRPPGARVDVNGDGIPDVRMGPYGQMRPDVGQFVHGPQMPYGGGMGYGGGARVDVNRQVRPDVGQFVHGPPMGGAPYYPHPYY